MDPFLIFLAVAFILIGISTVTVARGVSSFREASRQQTDNVKDGMSRTRAKHQILLNPIFHAYLWTIVALVIFSYIFYMYFYAN